MDRMFEPFVRGARNGRGSGLGLSITRDAVAALGGTVRVRDLPGKGCVFAIALPATPSVRSR
jgi:signal transduction histidine kinase